MQNSEQIAEIRQRAMGFLARREHAYYELIRKLSDREYSREQICAVLTELESVGLLSNRRFAECYIRSRASRGYGPYRICMELQERRVDDSIISEYLKADWDWYALAVQVRVKRFGEVIAQDITARAKQQRFLQYRGFSSEQINAAMRQKD